MSLTCCFQPSLVSSGAALEAKFTRLRKQPREKLHKAWKLEKSAKIAQNDGNDELATRLLTEATQLKSEGDEEMKIACEKIFQYRNRQSFESGSQTLDFHGLTQEEVRILVTKVIDVWAENAQRRCLGEAVPEVPDTFYFSVGKGIHSQGEPVLGATLESVCQVCKLTISLKSSMALIFSFFFFFFLIPG